MNAPCSKDCPKHMDLSKSLISLVFYKADVLQGVVEVSEKLEEESGCH